MVCSHYKWWCTNIAIILYIVEYLVIWITARVKEIQRKNEKKMDMDVLLW